MSRTPFNPQFEDDHSFLLDDDFDEEVVLFVNPQSTIILQTSTRDARVCDTSFDTLSL